MKISKITAFLLATFMTASNIAPAFASNIKNDGIKSEIINSKSPVNPAKAENGKTAADLITNPDQPDIYTLRTDYKVKRGEKLEINYQPYIASVGENLSPKEKAKVNQDITLPDLAGYEKQYHDKTYKIDYDTVAKAKDDNNEVTGDDKVGKRYEKDQFFRYNPKKNTIQIKHVFQSLWDFNNYTNPPGYTDENPLITTQSGNTGSTMEVSPLKDDRAKGFVPERDSITMQVPENVDDFILEYRYNRDHFDVKFETDGGTPLPNRTLYYEQVIPNIDKNSIPTKVGGDFLGWKPSITLKGKLNGTETTFEKDQIIKDRKGNALIDISNTIYGKKSDDTFKRDKDENQVAEKSGDKIELQMPAEKVTFTAVWKDKEKADYAIQFWAEKADHADGASILEKYDYMGARVYKNADTGTRPDLDTVSIDKIPFPDLDQARLDKIWRGETFDRGSKLLLNKFYVYNKDLTAKQNADPKKVNMVKSVESTGKTIYNIYYDRQVYDLYFTDNNSLSASETFFPEIYEFDESQAKAVKVGGKGDPYHFKARFNEHMKKWPNDAMQTKGFTPGWQSYGWGPNYLDPAWTHFLDTPPYRLNADEFVDMPEYDAQGGYAKKINKGDGTEMPVEINDFTTISFGIKQGKNSIPHHMDLWMDGFKDGETIVRYDLYRSKADTDSKTYGHKYPKVQGFKQYGYDPTLTSEQQPRITTEFLGEYDIDDKNDEREAETPFPNKKVKNMYNFKSPLGKMVFINAFFNNADSYGDPLEGDVFEKNGYLKFEYTRNKYPLRFNYDPSKIKGDNEFTDKNQIDTFYGFPLKVLSPDLVPDDTPRDKREYFKDNPANFLDNPENLKKLGLTDLVWKDPADGKLKVKRPANLSDQLVFKGWALDPAGTKLVWENKDEKMPNHALNLYAKWGEPDNKWKVTFDPNGGNLSPIKKENLTKGSKTIQEGDIGQEEKKTYPTKEANEGDKQVFTVIQRQQLKEPNFKPTKKGYDFLGWEIIRYKKDNKGDYTDEVDNSYRKAYQVPELYTFGNDVVAPVYLKAIWVPNERVDVKVEHYMLDKDYNLVKKHEDTLEDKRANYLVAATGDRQDDKYILAPHEELKEKLTGKLKTDYEEYNKRVNNLNNSFFQTFKVEPEKIPDPNDSSKTKDNPKVKDNLFKFFYRPFRKREYQVNYLDEKGKKEVDKFYEDLDLKNTTGLKDDELLAANTENKNKFDAKKNELEEIIKKYKIVDKEDVSNGNRHYDAINYRRFDGWVLADNEKAQQQLFFDLNEKNNEFLGINGKGSDQIFFYYKDVRVIEVPKDGKTPDGYVRVTFKADKGGSFGKDDKGNDITELHYDVIKGLKSDLLPVPKELGTKEDGTPNDKEKGKYYITPETGKKFIKWDEKPLLNKNTIVDNDTKDFYVFTAKFEWSGLSASGLVRTEAFKDPDGKWTNDFAPKIEDLKKQLVWKEKDEPKPLPAGTRIQLFDAEGNELTKDEEVYELVNEKKAADKDELVRTVNIKAKVTFTDGKEPQELDIPITVYKNVYEALTGTAKPLFLSEAEKGELKDITGDYVKVTVAPTGDMNSKDNKVYYVNPKAWVNIPEVKPDGSSTFVNWTADQVGQNENGKENGKFDFAKRHKFTEDTIITPVGAKDVVEQEKGKDKPDVPNSYVKVIVKTTDKATDETAFEKTFWVNPSREVSMTLANPEGKTDQEVEIPGLGKRNVNYVFKEWQKVKVGEVDDKLAEVKPPVKINLAKNKYTDKVTVIEAVYNERFAATPIVKPIKTEELHTPEGKEITDKDLIGKITPPENKEIESITVIERPDPSKPGKQEAKVKIKYKDGSTQGTDDKPVVIPVEVHKNIIPEAPGGKKPEGALDNYVKVIFKAGTGGSLSGDLVYYVSPEVEVDMTESAKDITKTADTGYFVNGEKWTNAAGKTLKEKFNEKVSVFEFVFDKKADIIEKTDENPNKPDGYVVVTFKTDGNGKVNNKDEIIYFVNPKAGIKLGKTASADNKTLVVPTPAPNENYVFQNWQEAINETESITNDRTHVAIFKPVQVTLTYDKGGEDVVGDVPASVTVNHGTSVRLARKPEGLSKENASFAGWKIGETTYQPGEEVTLNENTTATAQWKTNSHTVTFDTKGGTKIDSQSVEHGKMATKPVEAPTLEGKVFTGWKEQGKESEKEYFNFDTPIEENKTLVAIWQAPVQKINDGDTVEEQFVKVTFQKGDHGHLKLSDTEDNLETVTYKIAKGLTVRQAIAQGLKVPDIIADRKYYKGKGWDKDLDEEFAEGEIERIFTALYKPKADVIPVDQEITPDDKLQDDKPEGMVLVKFEVGEDFYMRNASKFYVKQGEEVRIPTPIVHNKVDGKTFDDWKNVTLVKETLDPKDQDPNAEIFKWVKQSFNEDTTIRDQDEIESEIFITKPKAGEMRVYIDKMDKNLIAKLQVVRKGVVVETAGNSKYRRRLDVFKLNTPLEKNDVIRYWLEDSNDPPKKSKIKNDIIY